LRAGGFGSGGTSAPGAGGGGSARSAGGGGGGGSACARVTGRTGTAAEKALADRVDRANASTIMEGFSTVMANSFVRIERVVVMTMQIACQRQRALFCAPGVGIQAGSVRSGDTLLSL
jgi:hypothetical protein